MTAKPYGLRAGRTTIGGTFFCGFPYLEDGGRVGDDGVDAAELLQEHHHHRDQERAQVLSKQTILSQSIVDLS